VHFVVAMSTAVVRLVIHLANVLIVKRKQV
jgi:hypothetical protein